jgi:hypothetical protein
MAVAIAAERRLNQAINHAGAITARDLVKKLAHRAGSDRELKQLYAQLTLLLEPPACSIKACPHFKKTSFCNCGLKRVPGRCRRRQQAEAKARLALAMAG